MSESRWPGPNVVGSAPPTGRAKEVDNDTVQAVIDAYKSAANGPEEIRRRAFEAALRTYRARYPGVSEPLARRRVARILCFAGSNASAFSIG